MCLPRFGIAHEPRCAPLNVYIATHEYNTRLSLNLVVRSRLRHAHRATSRRNAGWEHVECRPRAASVGNIGIMLQKCRRAGFSVGRARPFSKSAILSRHHAMPQVSEAPYKDHVGPHVATSTDSVRLIWKPVAAEV